MALRTSPARTGVRERPLIVTQDPILLDDLLRLAAAGSVEVTVAAEPWAARSGWSAAPFVLVGADCVAACAARCVYDRNVYPCLRR